MPHMKLRRLIDTGPRRYESCTTDYEALRQIAKGRRRRRRRGRPSERTARGEQQEFVQSALVSASSRRPIVSRYRRFSNR